MIWKMWNKLKKWIFYTFCGVKLHVFFSVHFIRKKYNNVLCNFAYFYTIDFDSLCTNPLLHKKYWKHTKNTPEQMPQLRFFKTGLLLSDPFYCRSGKNPAPKATSVQRSGRGTSFSKDPFALESLSPGDNLLSALSLLGKGLFTSRGDEIAIVSLLDDLLEGFPSVLFAILRGGRNFHRMKSYVWVFG